jgi:cytochrome P450 family 142 subfamily A polypeptide 1
VGDLDPFRDETIRSVEQLRAAGVPVEFRLYEGCCNGFDAPRPGAKVSRQANAFVAEQFAAALERHGEWLGVPIGDVLQCRCEHDPRDALAACVSKPGGPHMSSTPPEAPAGDPQPTEGYAVVLDRAGTRTPEHPTHPDVRLLSPDFYARGDELMTWLREHAPVYWDDATGIWGIAGHADIMHVSKHWQDYGSGQGSRPDNVTPMMINFDPPEHAKRRGIISAGFTPRRVQDHEPFLRRKVGELLDGVIERGECDFVRDVATPLPMYMIGELMGLPEADHEMLLRWSDLFATGGDEVREEVFTAVQDYAGYIQRHIAERRGGDGEDLVSLAVNAELDGRSLSDTDLVFETMLVLVGGDETTRHVISDGLEALLRHPDQMQALRADPSKLPIAIEEMLRWSTPIKNMNRTAQRDLMLGGQPIREGDRMLLLYPSGNRDATVFDEPFRFDSTRRPNEHLAFGGYGRHHCLGAQLARLELRVLFEEVLLRLPDLHLSDADAPLVRRRGNFVLGLESLPVAFTPGPRRG